MLRGETCKGHRVSTSGLVVSFALLAVPILGLARQEQERASRAKLFKAPTPEAEVSTLLTRSLPIEVLTVKEGWLRVKQGDSLGWITVEELGVQSRPQDLYPGRTRINPLPRPRPYSNSGFGGGLLAKLQLDRLVQDQELVGKMNHPFYRDRLFQSNHRWGFLVYERTRLFYVKGVRLADFRDQRVYLTLAKRRIFYSDIYGELWPEELLRDLIRAQPGLLGYEVLFGKGQEYYLELAVVF